MSHDELLNGPFSADQIRVIRQIIREELIASGLAKRGRVKSVTESERVAYPPSEDYQVGSL